MALRWVVGGFFAAALLVGMVTAFSAEPEHEREHAGGPPPAHKAEPHPGPKGYERPAEPKGWNARPGEVDRLVYQHNYQAARSYHIGPYHRPPGWVPHHWVYGQILPRAYWAAPYIIADFWLFGLEIPPAGFEWVRDGPDALLISVDTGEILQVEYGVFA